ncbi:MAG: toll/interleukin-1 receptor domain-containing protein [Ferrovibrio sp.]|uniref:toll/interleukin-1 receptor domain-containing protein n=1 Tax=Ferrovibrio sp. TaxID=1917215 RepID=UPI00391D3F10
MPVFISYSRTDSRFVDALAAQLVAHDMAVWMDRWEMRVGDSLVEKIQNALTEATAIIVVLSKESVKSQWCRKELNSSLMREMAERRVVILPVVIDDCEIPLLIQEKMYADFRQSFDDGLRAALEGLAPVVTESQSRIDEPKWHTDYGVADSGYHGYIGFELMMVETAENRRYSAVASIDVISEVKSKGPVGRRTNIIARGQKAKIIEFLASTLKGDPNYIFRLSDANVQTRKAMIGLPVTFDRYVIQVNCRWLGENTGGDVVYNLGNQLARISEKMLAILGKPKSVTKAKSESKTKSVKKVAKKPVKKSLKKPLGRI